ncbi:MAG: hypothetical protein HQM16_07305 [Deltaproteobacteria bacterium]|nr:hypothetical protein [Deltaproteobacteria bacterium]
MQTIFSGQPAIRQLYPAGVVHPANYCAEAQNFSRGDTTGGDLVRLDGRGLVALSRGDVVICRQSEVSQHQDMVRYLNTLGVSSLRPRDVFGVEDREASTPVCQTTASLLQQDRASIQAVRAMINGARHMVPFIASDASIQIASHFKLDGTQSSQAVDLANNKGALSHGAQQFGFLTPPTTRPKNLAQAQEQFEHLLHLADQYPTIYDNKVWLKLNRSSGGEGVMAFSDIDAFLSFLTQDHNPHKSENTTRADTIQKLMPKGVEKTFQGSKGLGFYNSMVDQGEYEGVVLQIGGKARAHEPVPNINFFVGASPSEDRYIGASAQVIEKDSIHVGNQGLSNQNDHNSFLPVIQKVAHWLRSLGFRGICGIDAVISPQGDIWVIDINARWNASTSTLMTFNNLRHLPGVETFRYAGKIRVPQGTGMHAFTRWLDLQKINFTPGRGGVIPINLMPAQDADHPVINAAILGPDSQTVSEYFDLAHMRP